MDYLFFDIECSEGRSICSFGYVLTDEFFCIKEKRDILINPQSYFHTGPWSKKAREKDEGISLAYPVGEFKAQPPFPAFYDILKGLLKRKDVQIVTFSGDNDARFLNIACTRYHMPCFNYTFIDVQRIYQDVEKLKDPISLEKTLAAFEIDVNGLIQHRSDDDAHITMLVTEALCRNTGKSLNQLVKESERALCFSKNYMPKKKKQKSANGAVSGESASKRKPANQQNPTKSNGAKPTYAKKKSTGTKAEPKSTAKSDNQKRRRTPYKKSPNKTQKTAQ